MANPYDTDFSPTVSAAPGSNPYDTDFGGEPVQESASTRALRVLKDPDGGVLPAVGSLVDSAIPDGTAGNLVRGVLERAAQTGANTARILSRPIDAAGEALAGQVVQAQTGREATPEERALGGSEIGRLARPYQKAQTGYVPEYTPEKIKASWVEGSAGGLAKDVLMFGVEQGVTSLPEMLLSVFGTPIAALAAAERIGQERAKNQGQADAGAGDLFVAAPFAVGSVLLDRLGGRGMLGMDAKKLGEEALSTGAAAVAKRIAAEGGKALSKEAATEALQEGVLEYVGEKWGTKAQMSWAEAAERGAWGALGGGVAGGGVGAARAAAQEMSPSEKRAIFETKLAEATDVDQVVAAATELAGSVSEFQEAHAALVAETQQIPESVVETQQSVVSTPQSVATAQQFDATVLDPVNTAPAQRMAARVPGAQAQMPALLDDVRQRATDERINTPLEPRTGQVVENTEASQRIGAAAIQAPYEADFAPLPATPAEAVISERARGTSARDVAFMADVQAGRISREDIARTLPAVEPRAGEPIRPGSPIVRASEKRGLETLGASLGTTLTSVAVEALPSAKDVTPTVDGDLPLSREVHGALSAVAQAFGHKIEVFSADKVVGDGAVLSSDSNTVYLNRTAQKPHLVVMGHEIGHQIEVNHPEAYAALRKVVAEELGAEGLAKHETDYAGGGLDEAVADLIGNRFQEPEFMQRVFEQVGKDLAPAQALGVITRLSNAISKVIATIRKTLLRQDTFAVDAMVKDLDKVKEAVHTALVAYAKQRTASAPTQKGQASAPKAPQRVAAAAPAQDAILGVSPGEQDREALRDEFGRFTARQSARRQTESEAFKAWFGKSKLVDAAGAPLVLYHGTTADFDTFKPSEGGILGPGVYLTTDRVEAGLYTSKFRMEGGTTSDGGNVMPVYARIENPVPAPLRMRAGFKGMSEVDEIAALMRMGYDGIITTLKSGEKVAVAFMPSQVKSALGNSGAFDPKTPDIRKSERRLPEVKPRFRAALEEGVKGLTDAEVAKLRSDTATKFVKTLSQLPESEEMAAIAWAGRAKRGWYKGSAEAMVTVFGPDAPRFAALLAALSPQTSVELNLQNALNTWKNWTAAGRPQTAKEIRKVMGRSVQGRKGEKSVLNAWLNNGVSALTVEDPSDTKFNLSGPKVNSFFQNLIGNATEVTNDTWMANYAMIEQDLFAGSKRLVNGKKIGDKGWGYMAMSSRVRMAAAHLTDLTGEEWTPAEVQETIWSWAKALYEAQKEGVSASELLYNEELTDELVNATPDFRTLFQGGTYAKILEASGLSAELATLRDERPGAAPVGRREGEKAPFDSGTQSRFENAAAQRLERLKAEGRPDRVRMSVRRPQIETPEFKKWFGDSKVVDADGEPLIVYHGTSGDFTEFDPARRPDRRSLMSKAHDLAHALGFVPSRGKFNPDSLDAQIFGNRMATSEKLYGGPLPRLDALDSGVLFFTSNQKLADEYAVTAIAQTGGRKSPGAPNVMPVYLKIEKLIVLDFSKIKSVGLVVTLPNGEIHNLGSAIYDTWAHANRLGLALAKKYGADGFVAKKVSDSPVRKNPRVPDLSGTEWADIYAVFAPTQIKSAIGNSGAFDPANPDIRKSERRPITLEGVHYSKQPRTYLSSDSVGTGLKGAERERGATTDRINFYVDTGSGVQPEAGVGAYAHRATLSNLYDMGVDPEYLGADAKGLNDFEKRVVDAGYAGYYNPDFTTKQGAAVLLGKNNIKVERAGEGALPPSGAAVPRASRQDTGFRATVAKLEGLKGLPAGALTPAKWGQTLKMVAPALHAEMADSGVFSSGADPVYKNELVQRFKAAQRRTVVNIGLDVNDGSKLTVDEAVAALREEGVEVIAQETQQSSTELTLVATLDRPLTPEEAHRVSVALRQEAIAQRVGGEGELYGPSAENWRPFDPEQFRAPGVRASERRSTFYSALQRQLESVSTAAAPAAGWQQQIKGLVNKGLVKQDEVTWSGLEEWLALQGGKVSKGDLLAYLGANGVRVEETQLGAQSLDVYEKTPGRWYVRGAENYGYGDNREAAQALADREDIREAEGANTKFGQYTLPGGTNYREVLLTLPGAKSTMRKQWAAWDGEDLVAVSPHERAPEDWAARGWRIEQRTVPDRQAAERAGQFQSGHWDQPNVLAHIRLNDRTDADGKRVLFVEEIQSDWGQAVKKYKDKNTTDLETALRQVDKTAPPSAPFVGKTEAWVSLALKRVIKMAVDEGYDRVALVTGEQASDLYDLSKQIDALHYEKTDDGNFEIEAFKSGNVVLHEDEIPLSRVEALVGKEVAKKIADGEGEPSTGGGYRNWRVLKGLDLKVGGEGMKAFYDKIVPSVAKEVLRKVGGGPVTTVAVPGINSEPAGTYRVGDDGYGGWAVVHRATGNKISEHDSKAETKAEIDRLESGSISTQPGFDITPAMRDKAKGGMPLFSPRRNIYNAVVAPTWAMPQASMLDNVLYRLQDKHIDLKRVTQAIGAIADRFDPYLGETLYHGRSADQTKVFADKELKPLLVEMKARGIALADFEKYLHNRHAEERNVQIAKVNPAMPDGGSGIKTADARAFLRALTPVQTRGYSALAARVDRINAGTRAMLVASGLETQDTIDAWTKTYSKYVPLQRADMDLGHHGSGTGAGFSTRGTASKRAMGSEREVVDILANLARQREITITRAEKNRVSQALYGLAVQRPNPDFWLPVNPEAKLDPLSQNKLMSELIHLGMSPMDADGLIKEPVQRYVDPATGLVTERINPALRGRDNVIAMRVDGKDRFVFMNDKDARAERLAEAFKNLDAAPLGEIMSVLGKASRWISSVNTQYNPIFGMINFLRDVQGASLNLSTTPLAGKQAEVMRQVMPALRGIYIDVRHTRAGTPSTSAWSQLWEEFQREGGQTGYKSVYSSSEERATAIADELKQLSEGKLKQGGRAILDWLSDYNESIENSVRLAAYKTAKDAGMTSARAAELAKDVTVNFNRKGEITSQAGALYAFFNAAVQGTERTVRTVTGPAGRKILYGGLLLGSLQALAIAAAGFDDGEPPDQVKERNLVLPLGDGKYATIPMPLGFNVIPGVSRLFTEFALRGFKDPTKLLGGIGTLAASLNPIGGVGTLAQTLTPTALDPLIALAENKDAFGRPIAKQDRSGLKPTPGFTRKKDTATTPSTWLAEAVNWATGGTKYTPGMLSPTPDQIDFLAGQIGGGVARELGKIEQAATSSVTGETLPPYKVPVLGRFYGDTNTPSAQAAKFYLNAAKLGEHELELAGRRKDKVGGIAEYIAANPEAVLVPMAKEVERKVAELRSKKSAALAKGDTARVKVLEELISIRMKVLNDRVKELAPQ